MLTSYFYAQHFAKFNNKLYPYTIKKYKIKFISTINATLDSTDCKWDASLKSSSAHANIKTEHTRITTTKSYLCY